MKVKLSVRERCLSSLIDAPAYVDRLVCEALKEVDQACERVAKERDDAIKERDEARATLVSRHGGEPLALLEELDSERAAHEETKAKLREAEEYAENCKDRLDDDQRAIRAERDAERALRADEVNLWRETAFSAAGERNRALDERDEARTKVSAWEEKAKVWLASPEAEKRLSGYMELGAKCAALEGRAERAESKVATLVEALEGAMCRGHIALCCMAISPEDKYDNTRCVVARAAIATAKETP
jgi:hypothetical protein